MYGDYTSINDMPEMADFVTEFGPFLAENRVTLVKNIDGHYTVNGEIETFQNAEDVWETAMWFDFSVLEGARPFDGLDISSNGQFNIEYEGMRYVVYNGPYNGRDIIYSMNYHIQNPEFMFNVTQAELPGDHPLIGCLKRVAKPVPPEA